MGLKRAAAVVLAAALVAAAGACGGNGERTIEVTIRHSRFEPEVITVRPGERVRFVVRNTDPIAHEFILGDEAVQELHERGTEHEHSGGGEISIPAGAERATWYQFGRPGNLIVGCHLPGHYDFGMRGTVRVA